MSVRSYTLCGLLAVGGLWSPSSATTVQCSTTLPPTAWSSPSDWGCGMVPNNGQVRFDVTLLAAHLEIVRGRPVRVPAATVHEDIDATIGDGSSRPLTLDARTMLYVDHSLGIGGGGTILNAGRIVLDQPTSSLILNSITGLPAAPLEIKDVSTSSGLLQLANRAAAIEASGPSQTLINQSTITGFGVIGNGTPLILENKGDISAESGTLTLDAAPAGNGQPTLVNYANLTARPSAILAMNGQNVENSGLLNVQGTVILSSTSIHGGTVSVATGGQLQLAGNGATIDANVIHVSYGASLAGSGTIFLNAGDVFSNQGTVASTLDLTLDGGGQTWNNGGTIKASGGQLTLQNGTFQGGTIAAAGGLLELNDATIGGSDAAAVNVTATGRLWAVAGTNTLDLSSGNFSNTGTVGTNGGAMTLAAVDGTLINAGRLVANTGTLTLSGQWKNSGAIDVVGPSGLLQIDGTLTNYGTMTNSGGTVQFENGFTNYGQYASDPADNYFTDLVIEPTGYLVAGADDRFLVTGEFVNLSTESALWNTAAAELDFLAGGAHDFEVSNDDPDFAWGILRVGAGQTIDFIGGAGTAQYLGVLTMDGGLADLGDLHSDGVEIYYQSGESGNAYLNGATYNLAGGGQLRPFVTPEPGTGLLLTLALAGAMLRRPRFKPFA